MDNRHVDRRSNNIPGRREEDKRYFDNCPRYDRHDLTEEQIIEIAKTAVIIAKNEAAKEIGEYVITEGKNIIVKVFFIIGAASLAVFSWVEAHNIKF